MLTTGFQGCDDADEAGSFPCGHHGDGGSACVGVTVSDALGQAVATGNEWGHGVGGREPEPVRWAGVKGNHDDLDA